MLWLKYELGTLYETQGLMDQALEQFMDVKETDSNFKDVKKKIVKLQKTVPSQDDRGKADLIQNLLSCRSL